MDFMLLYVETFCLGKVTEASFFGLELPGLEELELALIVLRTLSHLPGSLCIFLNFKIK